MDGVLLPIEYARVSSDGRLTLVITPCAKPIRTLWALMATDDLNEARESLCNREGIKSNNINKYIGSVTQTEKITKEDEWQVKRKIQDWLKHLNLDAAIWTNLPPKFKNREITPNADQAIAYLKGLDINVFTLAKEYVRKTPKQIDTNYRRRFEVEFGWTSIE